MPHQRFAFHRPHGLLAPLLSLFGARVPQNCYVEVGHESVEIRMGPLFRQRVALAEISDVYRRSWPLWLGLGWRTDLRGTIGLISNRAGVVEIGLRQPIRAWIAPWPIKVRRIAVSVADPDGLIAALS